MEEQEKYCHNQEVGNKKVNQGIKILGTPGQREWRVLDHGTVQCGMCIGIKRCGTHIRRPGQ